MPAGGVVQPDGRPPRAKGVGKTARRHDLEAPATPGLSGTDLQHGDVQRLEQAQQAAPRPKKQNGQGRPQPQARQAPQQKRGQVEVPDAIEFIGGRAGGTLDPATIGQGAQQPDTAKWAPLLRELARNPNASGPLTTTLMTQLSNYSRLPNEADVVVIDQNGADDAIAMSLE